MSEDKKKWYQDPDGVTKVVALVLLLLLLLCMHLFAGDVVHKAGRLAVSGNVKALAEYLRSFGPWAVFISFFIDVLINAGSIFPSIFLSTANGLIFGLPLGIAVSWLAETTGVVLSFLLMRFFFRNTAEKLIRKADRLQDIDKASEKNGIISPAGHRQGQRKERHYLDDFCPGAAIFSFRHPYRYRRPEPYEYQGLYHSQPDWQISFHGAGGSNWSRLGPFPRKHGPPDGPCNCGGGGVLYRKEEAV